MLAPTGALNKEATCNTEPFSTGILPNNFSSPPLKQTDALGDIFFTKNEKQRFYFWEYDKNQVL